MSTAVLIVAMWALVDVLIVGFMLAAGARRRGSPSRPLASGLVFTLVGGRFRPGRVDITGIRLTFYGLPPGHSPAGRPEIPSRP